MNDPIILVAVVLVALALIGAAAWVAAQRRKRGHLRARFGPEYDRTVSEVGDRRRAEHELEQRQERVRKFPLRALPEHRRTRYAEDWRRVQAEFVDSPAHAIDDAERLVTELMEDVGYPVAADFDQRAADLSVDHPHVVDNYRAARALSARSRAGEESTEDMRQAMVHYRALFDDLLGERTGETVEARSERA